MVRIWSSVNGASAFFARSCEWIFSREKQGRLEWEAKIGRRFELINDMLGRRGVRQAGLRFSRKAGEMYFGDYTAAALRTTVWIRLSMQMLSLRFLIDL